jgi:type III pantothenate kinase
MVTLCLDFGNTRLKAAIFNTDVLEKEFVLNGDGLADVIELLDLYKPEKSILSSVINHEITIEDVLARRTQYHKLSHTTITNFTTPVGKPQTIGADRLALAAAAVHFYPNKNNLIISLGTCITYNLINAQAQFIGGAISPGIDMRFTAMHQQTAKLPLVQKTWHYPLLGYDTETNLQSGVQAGITFEIQGFINEAAAKYHNFNAVLTGGSATYFANTLKSKIFADPKLLFKGLYALSQINNE